MNKIFKKDQGDELDFLYKLNTIFARFFLKKPNLLKITMDSLEKFYKKKNSIALKSMRMGFNDFCGMVRDTSLENRKILDEILKRELKIKLRDIENMHFGKIANVIKKEEIHTPEQYRLISERIEEIHDDKSKQKEVNRLNKLLVKYEQTHKPKNE